MTKNPTQQLIVEAVISCIEKYGLEKTTTRKIAKEAGTNIASINYYFRSKDELIARALDSTLEHMMEDLTAIVEEQAGPFSEMMQAWFTYLLEGVKLYPNVLMAHMYAPLVEKRFDTSAVEAFRNMLRLLEARAAVAYARAKPGELHFALVGVVSAMFFKVLAPGFFALPEQPSSEALAIEYTRMFERAISAD